MRYALALLLLVGCTPARHAYSCGPQAIYELIARHAPAPTTERISRDILASRAPAVDLATSLLTMLAPVSAGITWPTEVVQALARGGVRVVRVNGSPADLLAMMHYGEGVALLRDEREALGFHWQCFPCSDPLPRWRVLMLYAVVGGGDARLAEAQSEIVELTRLNWQRRMERDAARAATQPKDCR